MSVERVWVLFLHTDFEGDDFLGVYSTERRARNAEKKFRKLNELRSDESLLIGKCRVDSMDRASSRIEWLDAASTR